MIVYSVTTSWDYLKKNMILYHFFVSGETTLKQIYQYILEKNHEWYKRNLVEYKFYKVWYENLLTNEKANEEIQIKKLASIHTSKKITGETVKEVPHLRFKAIID